MASRLLEPFESGLIGNIILGVVIGMILSTLAASFAVLFLYYLVVECFIYFTRDTWSCVARVSLLCSCIFGWIIGRTLYEMETYLVTKEMDELLEC